MEKNKIYQKIYFSQILLSFFSMLSIKKLEFKVNLKHFTNNKKFIITEYCINKIVHLTDDYKILNISKNLNKIILSLMVK